MKGWRWVLPALVLALAGCADVVGEGYEYGTLAVRVTFGDSTPVANVPVDLYNFHQTLATGVTDADGRYVFRFVPFGDVGVRVRTEPPPGHVQSRADGIRVPQGERVDVSVSFFRPCCGQIRVRVADPLGAPVDGAGLLLYTLSLPMREERTGADGQFVFTGLFQENYGLRVTPPAGYEVPGGGAAAYLDGIGVSPASDTTLVFTLARAAAPLP